MRSPTGIRFSEAEHAAITSYAAAQNMSFSDCVRQAVRLYVDPDYGKGYKSLRELARFPISSMTLQFSQFLDDFAHAADKGRLIAEEPVWASGDPGRWRYDLAATAHKLADDNGLPVPPWCLKDEYFPQEEYFAFGTQDPEYRAWLRENTPREFRWRNLFLGPDILGRV